ncbi:MAG: hypothetical protein ACREUT_09160, partial [Steroidobacteraceae bacterium]
IKIEEKETNAGKGCSDQEAHPNPRNQAVPDHRSHPRYEDHRGPALRVRRRFASVSSARLRFSEVNLAIASQTFTSLGIDVPE